MSFPGEPAQASKRKKAERACIPCARSKTRCNGGRPCQVRTKWNVNRKSRCSVECLLTMVMQRCEKKGTETECRDRPRIKRRRDVDLEWGASPPENTKGKGISLIDWMFEPRPTNDTTEPTLCNHRDTCVEGGAAVPSFFPGELGLTIPQLPPPLQQIESVSNYEPSTLSVPPANDSFPTLNRILSINDRDSDFGLRSVAIPEEGDVGVGAETLLPMEGQVSSLPED